MLLVVLFTHFAAWGQGFERQAFYAAIADNNSARIEEQLALVRKNEFTGQQAFEGALLMRQAGTVSGASKKLKLFKEGKTLLEGVIARDRANAEYRFLRLLIQENAPNIVKYRNNLDEDKAIISQSYKKLPQATQSAIITYSKTSRILRPEDL